MPWIELPGISTIFNLDYAREITFSLDEAGNRTATLYAPDGKEIHTIPPGGIDAFAAQLSEIGLPVPPPTGDPIRGT